MKRDHLNHREGCGEGFVATIPYPDDKDRVNGLLFALLCAIGSPPSANVFPACRRVLKERQIALRRHLRRGDNDQVFQQAALLHGVRCTRGRSRVVRWPVRWLLRLFAGKGGQSHHRCDGVERYKARDGVGMVAVIRHVHRRIARLHHGECSPIIHHLPTLFQSVVAPVDSLGLILLSGCLGRLRSFLPQLARRFCESAW